MKGAFPLKIQDQSTRFRHFGRVIFNGFTAVECLNNSLDRDLAFKHALNGVDSKEGFGMIHVACFFCCPGVKLSGIASGPFLKAERMPP